MDVVELRRWIEDALARHSRDAAERGEAASDLTTDEIVDAVWGRLPVSVRRAASRAQVQASLTMLTLRHRIGASGGAAAPAGAAPLLPPEPSLEAAADSAERARQSG
jgi:hypothetical protein